MSNWEVERYAVVGTISMDKSTMKRKPRILIIGPGPDEIGGVTTFIQYILCSTLLKQKFTLLHMDTSRGQKNQPTAGRFSYLNLSLFLRQVVRLSAILTGKRPQVVHFNVTAGWSFWKTATFILMSRMFHAKTIAHIHGGDFNLFVDSRNFLERNLIGATLRSADAVVVLSRWWENYIRSITKSHRQIIVIPNAPDDTFMNELDPGKYPKKRKGNTVIFVGSIGKRKGIFDILKAIPLVIREWESVRFLFLGDEEVAGEKEQVLQTCRNSGLDGYTNFFGWVSGERKKDCYREADIFILPSHAENLPFALLEAMAMQLPVITTPVGGIPEVVQDGENGFLIEPGNEGQLAERILQLLKDPELRQRLGMNARKKIIEHFSPRRIAEEWEALYSSLYMPGEHQLRPTVPGQMQE